MIDTTLTDVEQYEVRRSIAIDGERHHVLEGNTDEAKEQGNADKRQALETARAKWEEKVAARKAKPEARERVQ
jgi:hypothetical protein